MEKIGMFGAMRMCRAYEKLGSEERARMREARRTTMIRWARANSPLYRERYAHLSEDCDFSALPPITKAEGMARFDDWTTDRDVRLLDIERFMEDKDNIGRKFLGKYLVFTTSGSTGNPLVVLCDDTTNNVMGAVNALRAFADKRDLRAFVLRGGKTIGVFATGGFYLSNGSVRARLLKMPWKRRQIAVTSALKPIGDIVDELNAFQPAMLGGYPSNLALLTDEAEAGRLCIRPTIVMTGGEYLSDILRERLRATFHCTAQTSYACTEAGTIACECKEGRLHVNDDWIIVEPVDRDDRPVPDGVQADHILITNLYNFTQPFIRYAVTDRVMRHSEACPCGNPAPWLTVEGRADDILSFVRDGKPVRVAPLSVYATLREVRALKRFQVVKTAENRLALRIDPTDGTDRKEAFMQAYAALDAYLRSVGVPDVDIMLSDDSPRADPGSGKFQHIIQTK